MFADFLSNLSMAKNGFPRMAISACFGGPVLSESINDLKWYRLIFIALISIDMLLGIGIPYTILFIKQQTYQIDVRFWLNNSIWSSFLAMNRNTGGIQQYDYGALWNNHN